MDLLSLKGPKRLKRPKGGPDGVKTPALAKRFESFGEPHPLFAVAATLRDKARVSRGKVEAYKAAEAEEQIAKFELRQRYEHNYLEARKQYGKILAERLFPRLGSQPRLGPEDEEPPEAGSGGE